MKSRDLNFVISELKTISLLRPFKAIKKIKALITFIEAKALPKPKPCIHCGAPVEIADCELCIGCNEGCFDVEFDENNIDNF